LACDNHFADKKINQSASTEFDNSYQEQGQLV